MSFVTRLLVTFIVAGGIVACSPDTDAPPAPQAEHKPTPYQLNIPATLSRNFIIPDDNPLTEEGVLLGRHLFYENRLSGNNTMSCATCHQQQKAFTDGKSVSFGIDRLPTKRSTMSLANMLWFTAFNWDGSAKSLEEQARGPIENPVEMHETMANAVSELQRTPIYPPLFYKAFGDSTITEENVLKALAQFQRTLISADSRYDRYLQSKEVFTPDEAEGMRLFMTHPEPSQGIRGGNCGDCHGGTLISLKGFHNNGLDYTFKDNGLGGVTGRETDNGKFKAPSLRNIALTAPYMHDGRFKSLEEVLDHYNEHVIYNSPNIDPLITEASNVQNGRSLKLTADEKQKIIRFLHTLTDSTFIQDPKFANPFTR
ncbi:cytochrome-c peroxidase [Pontibacter sp. Tf4]|uniref:cytochrome-c peroxidase n=1 Tax=Pontibacter sp. Tf4 TaxID=2761620 RepID=UPI00162A03D1|nr:cytochrome c peroxidase [Pontibacter sp. Tf4]MBB6611075.1 cytochrome-c peroxidase [Pontibacter sp. Tf4]